LACADLLDVGPWRGMELGGEPDDEAQATRLLRLRDGVYSYAVGGGWRVLERDGQEILRTDARGRLTHVQIPRRTLRWSCRHKSVTSRCVGPPRVATGW